MLYRPRQAGHTAIFATFCGIPGRSPLGARSIQALGTAASLSVAFGMVRAIYKPEQIGRGMAINTLANASGIAMAPIVGGFIVSELGWNWVFSAAVPFAVFSLIFSRALPAPEPQRVPFDKLGAVLCALTFGLLIGGLEIVMHGSRYLGSAMLAGSAILAQYFYRHEIRTPHPILPVDLLAKLQFAIALFCNFSQVVASMILILFLPFKLQINFGLTPTEIGSILTAYPIASAMIAPLSGYLSDKIPVYILSVLGLILSMSGLLLLSVITVESSHFDMAWRLWLCGAGFGMFLTSNARLIICSAPVERAASAGSMVSTTRILSQALGATLFAGLLSMGISDNMVPIWVAVTLVGVTGAFYIFFMKSTLKEQL